MVLGGKSSQEYPVDAGVSQCFILGPTATLFALHIFYGTGANWYQIQKKTYTKSFQILCRKKISMLTGLKVSPLAHKCVFYRPDHNTNGGPMKMNFGLEMQK